MAGGNDKTLRSYQDRIGAYVDGTTQVVSGPVGDWIDRVAAGLSPSARILELGSAFGRDAAYLQSKGLRVECSDAVAGFVAHLRGRGLTARPLNLLHDAVGEGWNLIFANAVLLHFDRDEFAMVLAKISRALAPGGRFAFSLKQGQGEEWSSAKLGAPRYFCYWQSDELAAQLAQAGFSHWTMETISPQRGGGLPWIFAIAIVSEP